jgi:hypothetical protein
MICFPWNLEAGEERAIGEYAYIYNLGRVTIGARNHFTSRAPLRGHTRSYEVRLSVAASSDHAGQWRHRLEHGRYQGRFNFREAGCHSTQPAPNPSIEARDKASCCFLLRAAVEIVL